VTNSDQLFKRGEGYPVSFEGKLIQCSDCGATFTVSADDREFFASKGYTNEPKRCFSCRQSRKAERYGGSGYSQRPQRQLFPAVCAQRGKDTQVSFEPREGKTGILQRLLQYGQNEQIKLV